MLFYKDADTQGWIIAAVSKLVSQMGNFTDEAQSHVACYLASINIDLQQVGGVLSACCMLTLTVKLLIQNCTHVVTGPEFSVIDIPLCQTIHTIDLTSWSLSQSPNVHSSILYAPSLFFDLTICQTIPCYCLTNVQ